MAIFSWLMDDNLLPKVSETSKDDGGHRPRPVVEQRGK